LGFVFNCNEVGRLLLGCLFLDQRWLSSSLAAFLVRLKLRVSTVKFKNLFTNIVNSVELAFLEVVANSQRCLLIRVEYRRILGPKDTLWFVFET
jgi:hypothetical protein